MLVGLPIGAWLVSRALRPLDRTLDGLHFGIASFRDHDYSVRLASDRSDELGALAEVHGRLSDAGVNVFASNGVADGRGGYGYIVYVRPNEFEAATRSLGI